MSKPARLIAIAALSAGSATIVAAAEGEPGGLSPGTLVLLLLGALAVVFVVVLVRRGKAKTPTPRPANPGTSGLGEMDATVPEPDWDVAVDSATVFRAMRIVTANVDGPLAGCHFDIGHSGLTIGRSETCEVVHVDETVSREHARLSYSPQGLVLVNLSHVNQTFVNDRAIQKEIVRPGDRIRIAKVVFVVQGAG